MLQVKSSGSRLQSLTLTLTVLRNTISSNADKKRSCSLLITSICVFCSQFIHHQSSISHCDSLTEFDHCLSCKPFRELEIPPHYETKMPRTWNDNDKYRLLLAIIDTMNDDGKVKMPDWKIVAGKLGPDFTTEAVR